MFPLSSSTNNIKMRATYHVVDWVANFSGISWRNDLGANITPESESVWTNLVKVSIYLLFFYCYTLTLP
jgi:hypothetical protein